MDPIDIEDTQEVYTEVVEKKTRQYGQGNAGRCRKSRAKKNYSKKRKYDAPKEENNKKRKLIKEKHLLPAIKRLKMWKRWKKERKKCLMVTI